MLGSAEWIAPKGRNDALTGVAGTPLIFDCPTAIQTVFHGSPVLNIRIPSLKTSKNPTPEELRLRSFLVLIACLVRIKSLSPVK